VAPLMIAMINELLDLFFKITRQEVILQQNAVLQTMMLTFDFNLRLQLPRRAANMTWLICTQY